MLIFIIPTQNLLYLYTYPFQTNRRKNYK